MKKLCVFICVFALVSCEYFNVKKTSSEAILNEELKTFNWIDVDEYPSVSACDSISGRKQRAWCFENAIVNHITKHLQREVIVVTRDVNDTIFLKFQVNREGHLALLETKLDSTTLDEIPDIHKLLSSSLENLPKIYPASKKGQLVTTEFSLPIIINVK
ncbi:hypothetical protein [Cognatitamlana onchidii]|uniref:hypothetical protein n=1 Tax=Cognatitamlana onchidii TaxID=2562860 RepID=UPI0010A62258|nr:hypothetical protein [Algibacter onchidii]